MKYLEEQIQEILKDSEIFTLKNVSDVNHKPHPFIIGPRHIERYHVNTSKSCYHKGCRLSYEEHTFDKVCFLQLKRECSKEEAQKELKSIVDICGEKAFDGFSFIETDEKFRIV